LSPSGLNSSGGRMMVLFCASFFSWFMSTMLFFSFVPARGGSGRERERPDKSLPCFLRLVPLTWGGTPVSGLDRGCSHLGSIKILIKEVVCGPSSHWGCFWPAVRRAQELRPACGSRGRRARRRFAGG
jgi:hypothetical protein